MRLSEVAFLQINKIVLLLTVLRSNLSLQPKQRCDILPSRRRP